MPYQHPQYLVQTDWLAAHLHDPDLRILECTVFRRTTDRLDDHGRLIRETESGRGAWEQGHIPGSVFADLLEDLSDPAGPYIFTLPSVDRFAAAMSRYGVSEGTRVICYDRSGSVHAARVWWLLRAFGHENAAVLSGGWEKWEREGRPTSTDRAWPPPGNFIARPRPGLFADKDDVLAAIRDGRTRIVNALSADLHHGEGPTPYGRPGRIAGSVNVPAGDLLDPETGAFLPAEDLRTRFEAAGISPADRVITYCGGGIAACGDALALALLGHEEIAVYDASLAEWALDESLPMERGRE